MKTTPLAATATRVDRVGCQCPGPDRWGAVHYDVDGVTRVVLQKVSSTATNGLDEHVIATIRTHDPEYDTHFLGAMAAAREC